MTNYVRGPFPVLHVMPVTNDTRSTALQHETLVLCVVVQAVKSVPVEVNEVQIFRDRSILN